MTCQDQFELFLRSGRTREFMQFFNDNVPSSKHPSINYFGVNFSENQLESIKLYYTFFKIADINIAKSILPHINDFERYFPFYKEGLILDNQDTGCAFTLKASSDANFIKGFHFRFPKYKNPLFELPKFIQLTSKDLENYQGISYEYSDSGIMKKKRYYYITDAITIKSIAEQWNNDSILDAELVEYTEAGEERKIIIWNYKRPYKGGSARIELSSKHSAFCKAVIDKFGMNYIINGEYLNRNEKASYFYRFKDGIKFPYDFRIHGSIDSIGPLLHKMH